jgi:E3 ubiquitin-protein ligase RNF38/44
VNFGPGNAFFQNAQPNSAHNQQQFFQNGMQVPQGGDFFNGLLSDVSNMVMSSIQQTQGSGVPNIQMNFNGNTFHAAQPQPANQFQFNTHANQQYFFGQPQHAQDQEEELDEDGQPLPSPEEIKNIINGIPESRYEEKKQDHEDKPTCVICMDNIKENQMVKTLKCSHNFHSKCINNWLKLKLKCPLCKVRVSLN